MFFPPAVTCQLFLRLRRVGVSEQGHGFGDAAAALDLLLAAVALEGQVAQGGRGRLADLRAGAAQQSHQRRDSLELQHLPGDEVIRGVHSIQAWSASPVTG